MMSSFTLKENMVNRETRLNNGVSMPLLGLGTWQLHGNDAYTAVRIALDVGYRLIDSAQAYGNETDVGKAVKDSGIPREDIFITTKISNQNHGYQSTLKSVHSSLDKLQMDYVDLLLIHWPGSEDVATWKACVDLNNTHARAVGVSNFGVFEIEKLLDSSRLKPAVNQICVNPLHYPKSLCHYCTSNSITVEGYSPLARSVCLANSDIQDIAQHHNKSTAQIAIRWSLQHGYVTLPKSSQKSHISENADVADFSLPYSEMNILDHLSEFNTKQ